MLAFGFTHSDNYDIFSEEDPNLAVLVTERGDVLGGSTAQVDVLEPQAGDSLSRELMRQRLDLIVSKRQAASREMGDVPISLAVLTLDVSRNDDDEQEILSDFLWQMNQGVGRTATTSDFLDLLELDRDIDDEPEAQQDMAADMAATPHPEPPATTDYLPRTIGTLTDLDVVRRARAAGMTLLLSGEPGTGKTSLCEAAYGSELITVSCHDGMTVSDLVGQWMPVPKEPGNFQWHDGPLLTAMQAGRPLLLDDVSLLSLTVQAALLPVLDHRRSITVMDRPEENTISASDDFAVVLAQNPGVGVGISDAIRDRVAFEIKVPTDLRTAQELGADPDLLTVAYRLEEEAKELRAQGAPGWVPSIRTLLDATRVRQVFGTAFAASTFLADCPIQQPDFRERLRGMLQTQTGETVTDGMVSDTANRF